MRALDPDVARALDQLRAAGRPPFEALTVAEARAMYRAGRDTVHLPPIPIETVEDVVLAGRPARRYRPAGADDATILFLHGGGYVMGDLDTHDGICRRLAVNAQATVVALDYRLAPEHPFPAAFDDCLAACRAWGSTVAIAGDSAGGALAIAVALATPVAALALFYPVSDVASEAPSYARVSGVPITADTMRWFWNHSYTPHDDRADWRAFPLCAAALGTLPPTFLTTAGHDPLCDEGLALADRLCREGVQVEHRHLPGQIHGYLTLGRLIPEADQSILAAGRFLAATRRASAPSSI